MIDWIDWIGLIWMKRFTFNFGDIVPAEEEEYWAYYPGLFSEVSFIDMLKEFEDHCVTYTNKIYGKIYEAKRISCVVGANFYGQLPGGFPHSPLLLRQFKLCLKKKGGYGGNPPFY